MRKYLFAALLLLSAGVVYSQVDTIEKPIRRFSAPVSVSVSNAAFTNVTSAAVRIRHLSAVLVNVPDTNTASMYGHIGNCTSTAVATSVEGPLEFAPAAGGGFVRLEEGQCLWIITRAGGAEDFVVQGTSQKRN